MPNVSYNANFFFAGNLKSKQEILAHPSAAKAFIALEPLPISGEIHHDSLKQKPCLGRLLIVFSCSESAFVIRFELPVSKSYHDLTFGF